MNNEAILTQNVLMFIAHSIDQGDQRTLASLGLGSDHILELSSLNLKEFASLTERFKAHFLEIKINTDNLTIVLKDLKEIRLLESLIQAGAPNALICQTLLVTPKQCAARRKELGIDGYAQKKVPCSEEEETLLIEAWQKFKAEIGRELTAEDWLDLHHRVAVDYCPTQLKIIWRAIHTYNLNEAEYQQQLHNLRLQSI